MAKIKVDILYKKNLAATPMMAELILPSQWSVMQGQGGVSVSGDDIKDDTITADNIEGATITAAEIANGTITGTQIANATITATNITAATITANEIANATITATEIANATITATEIANATITATQIANATIIGSNIANTTIEAGNIANSTITTTQISGTAGITGSQIANATISGSNIGATTIEASNIANATITGTQIAATTIAAGNIANATITATQISGTAGITGGQIANATIIGTNISASADIAGSQLAAAAGITGGQIANTTITGGNITNNTITVGKTSLPTHFISGTFTDNSPSAGYVAWSDVKVDYNGTTYSITNGNTNSKYIWWDFSLSTTTFQTAAAIPTLANADVLVATNTSGTHRLIWNASDVNGDQIQIAAITGSLIANTTITGGNIANNTIQAGQIASATITGSEIAGTTISGSNIVNNTITATQIQNATITTTQIASATIAAGNIASATITATQIANLTITGGKIANTTITDANISSLSASKISAGTMSAARINGGDINGVTITGVTVTGGTVRTNSATYPYAVMNSSGITIHGQYLTFKGTTGTGYGQIYGDPSYGLFMSSYTGKNTKINAAANLLLNAGGTYLYLTQGNNTKIRISSSIINCYVPVQPYSANSIDLGTSTYKWRSLYLDQNLHLDTGQNIYWSGTSYYLKHDGTQFKINDDLQPHADGSKRLGYTNMAWYAVHSDNYLGCNLPASESGLDIFKKIKSPKLKDGKAKGYHAGKRHYFEIDEFPDEMKMTDKDSGKKDIEITRTLGVTVSAVREMVEEIDKLKELLKISNLRLNEVENLLAI